MKRIKLAAIWKNVNETTGEVYYSGPLSDDNVRIEVRKNTFKKEDTNHPDFYIYIIDNKKEKTEPSINNDDLL